MKTNSRIEGLYNKVLDSPHGLPFLEKVAFRGYQVWVLLWLAYCVLRNWAVVQSPSSWKPFGNVANNGNHASIVRVTVIEADTRHMGQFRRWLRELLAGKRF